MTSEQDRYQGWISSLQAMGINQYAAWILAAARPFNILLTQLLTFSRPLIPEKTQPDLIRLIALLEDEQQLEDFSARLMGEERTT